MIGIVTRRRRWKLGLSLRTTMILIAIVAVLMGRLAYRARVRRDALRAIFRAGGSIAYDWNLGTDGLFRTSRRMPIVEWLSRLLGRDLFETVAVVSLDQCSDADLASIAELDGLVSLSIESQYVTDRGLECLRNHPRLRHLTLACNATGNSLVHLRGMPKLKRLLVCVVANDAQFAPIEDLKDLEQLIILSPNMTDAGLAHLTGIVGPCTLQLRGTTVTSAGLMALNQRGNFRNIYIGP